MTKNNSEKENPSPMSDDKGDFLLPPVGYSKELAETFAQLPYAWRRYLTTREEEIDKGFGDLRSKIAAYKWLDDAYGSMAAELSKDGVLSLEDWLRRLISVEQQLRLSPRETIRMLSCKYGIEGNDNSVKFKAKPSDNIWSNKIVEKQLQDFINGKDDEGKLKHPFYQDVLMDIYRLLETGTASNLEEAYEMAVWLNKSTRAKMIAENVDASLQNKTQEAQKSKAAAFAASGKSEPDFNNMSLREELEHRFAALGFVDE